MKCWKAVGILFIVACMHSAAAQAQVFMTAVLDSSGTGSGSVASGTAWGVLSADMTKLTYQVTYANLQGSFTVSHFHHSGLVTGIPFTGTTGSGEWTGLTDADIQDLLCGRVYVNVHSTVAPGGEIRGFLQPVQGIGFSVAMDGTQAGTSSTGQGTGWVVLDSAGARITWNATVGGLTNPITAAHFHYLGGLHSTPFTSLSSSGTWSAVPDTIVRQFAKGDVYMNVHTSTFPAGEIHGTVKLGSRVATGVEKIDIAVPASFRLEQNFPNPFNPSTTIRFIVEKTSRVTLKVYNLIGQEVSTLVNDLKPAGTYEASFDAGSLASGVYMYRLTSDAGFSATRKLILLK